MKVDPLRIQNQSEHEYVSGCVLYWMNRDMRLNDNWALLRAQELAHLYNVELCVVYNLDPEFLGGTLRQLDFKIKALQQLHVDFEKYNIGFTVLVDSDIKCVSDFIQKYTVGYLVTDFAPLRIQREWLDTLISKSSIPIEVVDTHNIVPIWEASSKKEFAAYTIRPKIQKRLKEFLTDFPKLKKQKERTMKSSVIPTTLSAHVIPAKAGIQDYNAYLEYVLNNVKTNREVKPVSWCTSGEKSAHKVLKKFIEQNSFEYAEKRNDPVNDVQSQLSPYLHYGMILAQRIAFEIQKK